MDAIATIPAEGAQLITRATTFPVDVQGVRINTPDEAQAAVDQTRQIKALANEIEEYRKSLTKPLDDEKKAIMDTFRPATEFLSKCELVLKGSITAFNQEQARIAAAAEKELRRLQQIELDRQAQEQAEAEALLAQAEAAALAGDSAAAELLEEKAIAAQAHAAPIATYVPPVVTKAKGSSSRTIWKCKVIDPSKLDRAYLMPNQVVLDALAATAKGIGAAPAGCEWTSSDSLSIR
jgi:hypothetical protein